MTITAKVIADSYNVHNGSRLTTMELYYPRFIHAEFMTHRMFSRNASSSRAIPVKTVIKSIMDDPAMPIHWGKNQKGMQADEEQNAPVWIFTDPYEPRTEEEEVNSVTYVRMGILPQLAWKAAMYAAIHVAKAFDRAGYHKQIVNRLLEPFSHIRVIVTATEWDNFFALRLDSAAQPEMQQLARQMKEAMDNSQPAAFSMQMDTLAGRTSAHLPYILPEELPALRDKAKEYFSEGRDIGPYKVDKFGEMDTYGVIFLSIISAARCARVSYRLHDGGVPSVEDDISLATRLLTDRHMSPFEHTASPCTCPNFHHNLRGFFSLRAWIEQVNETDRVREEHQARRAEIEAMAETLGGRVVELFTGDLAIETEDVTHIGTKEKPPEKGKLN